MQIVTDSGTDIGLSPEEPAELNIHVVPLKVTLDGKTYREGIDIQQEEFYKLLENTDELPVTTQPSPGDFADLYRELAKTDPDILSIHMSSGLSGTHNSALLAAEMVPEANITHVDTKTLSAAAGWQVVAAAKAAKAGWKVEHIQKLVSTIGTASDSLYTLKDLKYLIHGGRISHIKGLLASVLHIKPLIGVEKIKGTYVQLGQMRTFKKALQGLVDKIAEQHKPGSELRIQVRHSNNPEGAAELRALLDKTFKCTWLPITNLSLVLGAHTGPSMVGVAFSPLDAFADIS